MRFERVRSQCNRCPLRDGRRVWSEGPPNPKIAFIGEAPGAEEAVEGRPFVGPAGRFLNWGFGETGIHRHQVWIMNLLPCRLPNNDWHSAESEEAQKCCYPGLLDELKWLQAKAVLWAPLGAQPMSALGISGSITENRGSVFETGWGAVIPTFHPAYLIRSGYSKGDTQVNLTPVWLADLAKIRRLSNEGYKPIPERFILYPTVHDVDRFCDACLGSDGPVGVDVETTGIDPARASLVVIGLARSPSDALSIPLLARNGIAYWSPEAHLKVKRKVEEVFRRCKLIFQSATFDVRHLRAAGWKLPYESIQGDTLLLHHAISPELPHNLGFITSLYGSTPYWKAPFKQRDGSILEMADEDLRRYNLRDAVVLLQVLPGMLTDLHEGNTESIYREESLRLIRPIIRMMDNGILLNKRRLARWKAKLKREGNETERRLKEVGRLPAGFNLNSDDDLRLFLYGIIASKFTKAKADLPSKRGGTKIHAKLTETIDILNQTHPLVELSRLDGRRTPKGRLAVDKQGLLSLQVKAQNRLTKVQRFKRPTPEDEMEKTQLEALLQWLALFRYYREVEKLSSTYTHFPAGKDGRVRSSFLIHGTATGRLSSSSPNLQNVPPEARGLFVPAPNHTFLAADYSNLEVRILAYETGETTLIDFLKKGGNIHDANAQLLFGISPKDPLWDSARRAAKTFQFGRIQYGGTDREIYEKVILGSPELRLTFSDFRKAVARWFSEHPRIQAWSARVSQEATDTRRVSNAFGRVRILMGAERDLVKESLNFPIQSAAASIINRAMIRIDARMEKEAPRSKMILQIHDSLVFEVWKDELKVMRAFVKAEMERPVDFRGHKVVFPVEMKTGTDWSKV